MVSTRPAPAGRDAADSPIEIALAATAEDLEPATPGAPVGGLTIQATVRNTSATPLAGVEVRLTRPAGTRLTESWIGQRGGQAGSEAAGAIIWRDLNLPPGGTLGPLAFRVEPTGDGARTFHDARSQAEVRWQQPAPGSLVSAPLKLNGLWGEGGLRRTLLPNGLTVFTRERPDSTTVMIRIAIGAGSRDEDDVTSGGSHWLEHAHFLGTPTRPDNQAIFSSISSVGGQTNASTGWEATDYWHFVPAEHFDLALEVVADQLLNSTFREEAFNRERKVVFEELKMRHDTPSIRATDEFLNLVFRTSPLRRHPGGTIESVQNIPIETILDYRARYYRTGNMAAAVSGKIQHDEVVEKIARTFDRLEWGERNERPRVPEPVQTEPRRFEGGEGKGMAEIRLGWPAPGDEDPDSPAMLIVQDILGGTGRRLSEEIRVRRALAIAIGPAYYRFSDAGTFAIYATAKQENAEPVIDLALQEVRRIRDGGVTEEDVQTSLRAVIGQRAMTEESNFAQTERAVVEVSGRLESFEEYLARLRAVSAADVQRVARKYLDPENFTLAVVRS